MIKETPCILFDTPDRVSLARCGLRSPGEDAVLLESLFTSVSPGTELRCLSGRQQGIGMARIVPGYQGVARVLENSEGLGLQKGDIVFRSSGRGFEDGLIAGWGVHAKYSWCPPESLVKVPHRDRLADYSIVKLAAIARHGVRVGRIREGERVAVVGLGMLGHLAALFARLEGAEVVGFDRIASRVDLAVQAGVEAYVVEGKPIEAARESSRFEEGFDVILDVTGHVGLVGDILELAHDLEPWGAPEKDATRYIVQGSYPENFTVDYLAAFLKEVSFIFPRDNGVADVSYAIDSIASGKLDTSSLTGIICRPEECEVVYSELKDSSSSRMSAVFDWSGVE